MLRLTYRFTGLLALSCAAFAQQFTADMVRLKPPNNVGARVFVSGARMRFETTSQEHSGVTIMDLEKQTRLLLVPASKTYVSWPGRAATAMPFFLPPDADDACAAWEKWASKPGTCTKVGDETINGRSAVRYKGTAQNGEIGFAWVDRQLKFVTKWESEKNAVEFQNVKEGPQPASLFEVPSDYEKIDAAPVRKGSKSKRAKPVMTPRPSP